MIYCNRTNKPVTVSELEDYVFYDESIDEDLYRFETHLKVSDDVIKERDAIIAKSELPLNYSNDKQLESFVTDYLKNGAYNLSKFKTLDVLKRNDFEFDELVLLSILYAE